MPGAGASSLDAAPSAAPSRGRAATGGSDHRAGSGGRALRVPAGRLDSEDVLDRLEKLFVSRGTPDFIRSDYGSEFTAQAVRDWLERVGVDTLFITPGSPWENGYIESFNGKLRDGEAKILIERWRQEYNTFRPHSALGYRPPAPEAVLVERRLVAGPLRDGSRPTRHCRRPPV
jgi:hypothetical protein